jgi:hypothetical protein
LVKIEPLVIAIKDRDKKDIIGRVHAFCGVPSIPIYFFMMVGLVVGFIWAMLAGIGKAALKKEREERNAVMM